MGMQSVDMLYNMLSYEPPKDNDDNKDPKDHSGKDHKNDKHKKRPYNPLQGLYRKDAQVYDRDKMINVLVERNGLLLLLVDLKTYKDAPRDVKPQYIDSAIHDIIFASALPEAIDKVFIKNDDLYMNKWDVKKKDLHLLMEELLKFCNSKNSKTIDKYGCDAVESMVKSYTNILYKLNKKKIKKFKDIDLSDAYIKRLVILTSGKSIDTTIYRLLNYIYTMADEDIKLSKKSLIKIFKACYGKKCMPDVAKYLMLERAVRSEHGSNKVIDTWLKLDEIMRDTLESLNKKDIEKILKSYVSTRINQEGNRFIPRRLGDRRSIHPDDYKKLTKAFEKYETEDFSVVRYFR